MFLNKPWIKCTYEIYKAWEEFLSCAELTPKLQHILGWEICKVVLLELVKSVLLFFVKVSSSSPLPSYLPPLLFIIWIKIQIQKHV